MKLSRPQIVEATEPLRSAAGWHSVCVGVGSISAKLVNGVFGDPLLEVQLSDHAQRLLFDLGDAAALSRRMLHSVSDVFITHAHFDHICGFMHLLRARMTGDYPPCRLFGPPGTADHIKSFIAGIRWDRIEDAGPEFMVADVYADYLEWTHLKVGHAPVRLARQPLCDAVISQQTDYCIRCSELDHGIPVLAYALELKPGFHVDQSHLRTLGLKPGPWIRALKQWLRDGDFESLIELPDDRKETASRLRDAVVTTVPGKALVYATDFADLTSNREKLRRLAQGADLLFCEATFRAFDAAQARFTQHLTTRACSEIALSANVARLVPFHFSKRYTGDVSSVYAEIREAMAR